tara:strand:+ start:1432 stop:3291 length:1860 start_codon:yes stop_codon:yes gene_type:complete
MPLIKLAFKPGINREGTSYSNEGGWYDGNYIRFRSGYVERIGGWQKANSNSYEGNVRKLHDFVTLSSQNLLFMGSEKKIYLEESGALHDITPIRSTVTLPSNPITTAASGGIVTVTTSTAHGAAIGDFVTFASLTATDGITTAQLNKEHTIATIPSTTTFTVDTGGTASSGSTAGGGSSGTAAFQISVGIDTTVLGNGWGAGTWGRFTWNSSVGSLAGQTLRLWFADDFGEDLIANVADGQIFFWDATNGTNTRAVLLSSLSGASDVPSVARKILVSDIDSHVLCFGTNPIGSATQDPLLIRWSSQESAIDWTPTQTNTAGSLRLSQGSEIVAAVRTSRQILVFTDHSLHSVSFIGAPYTFGTALLADNIRIAGPNTAISINDVVFWMGQENFYVFDGRITPIPCSVRDYVFSDINRNQSFKFHVGSLASQSEVWWYYCTANSNEIDRYVVYNYANQTWYYGSLTRTAWNDRAAGQRSYPQAASTDKFLYNHEFGLDDGSTDPVSAINAFVESSDFDLGDGYQFMFIRRLLPDLTFNGSDVSSPAAVFTMKSRDFSGDNYSSDSDTVTRTSSSPVEQYTNEIFLRERGRQMSLKIENTAKGVKWRLGAPRLDAQPDGRR